MLLIQRGKAVLFDGVELSGGRKIRDIQIKEYKYLRILEYDEMKESEMKESFRREYLRKTRLIMGSRLEWRNKNQSN